MITSTRIPRICAINDCVILRLLSITAVTNLWHACPKWHARRFYVACHVIEIYQEIMMDLYTQLMLYVFNALREIKYSEVVKKFQFSSRYQLQNSLKHSKGYHEFSHNILCVKKNYGSPIFCQFTMVVESFTSMGFMHANGRFFLNNANNELTIFWDDKQKFQA